MNLNLLAGKSMLVVEDNSINQMLVKHILSKSGAKSIHIASNGIQALDFIKANSYDIILMDIHMPEMDGYQTTLVIRNILNLTVPIVAMTALAIKGEDQKCMSIGINGYVAKPFTMDTLYNELERVITDTSTAQPKVQTNTHQLSDGDVTIDLSYLDELASSDKAYIKTMINLFIENMPGTIEKMEQYNRTRDWENLIKTAQFAKSSLAIIKVRKLHDLASQIENVASVKQDNSAIFLIQDMQRYYIQAQKLLYKELELLSIEKQVA